MATVPHSHVSVCTWWHCPDSWSAGRSRRPDRSRPAPPDKTSYSPPWRSPSLYRRAKQLSLWAAPLLGSYVQILLERGQELGDNCTTQSQGWDFVTIRQVKNIYLSLSFSMGWISRTYCHCFSCGPAWSSAAPGSSEGEYTCRFPGKFAETGTEDGQSYCEWVTQAIHNIVKSYNVA